MEDCDYKIKHMRKFHSSTIRNAEWNESKAPYNGHAASTPTCCVASSAYSFPQAARLSRTRMKIETYIDD